MSNLQTNIENYLKYCEEQRFVGEDIDGKGKIPSLLCKI